MTLHFPVGRNNICKGKALFMHHASSMKEGNLLHIIYNISICDADHYKIKHSVLIPHFDAPTLTVYKV